MAPLATAAAAATHTLPHPPSHHSAAQLKRPKSPYTLFMQETSKTMKKGGRGPGTFMQEIAAAWRMLPSAERLRYMEAAAAEQASYAKRKSMLLESTSEANKSSVE